jgi:hypothetical protein
VVLKVKKESTDALGAVVARGGGGEEALRLLVLARLAQSDLFGENQFKTLYKYN